MKKILSVFVLALLVFASKGVTVNAFSDDIVFDDGGSGGGYTVLYRTSSSIPNFDETEVRAAIIEEVGYTCVVKFGDTFKGYWDQIWGTAWAKKATCETAYVTVDVEVVFDEYALIEMYASNGSGSSPFVFEDK